MSILDTALKYYDSNMAVIPIGNNKNPACSSWSEYQDGMQRTDVQDLFKTHNGNIAIIGGVGNVEIFDIDLKNDPSGLIWEEFKREFEKFFNWTDFVYQKTPSGGYHLIYRCAEIGNNQKLGKVKNGKKYDVVFETRGHGGYALCYPSKGYEIINGDLMDIPSITIEQRNTLFMVALSLNQEPYVPARRQKVLEYEKDKPWDDFNSKNGYDSICAMLLNNGWTEFNETKDRVYFTRPGKSTGISGDVHKEKNMFKALTSNSEFQQDKGYTPYAVYTVLEFGGNYSDSAKAIVSQGYGKQEKIEPLESFWDKVQQRKGDFYKPISKDNFSLFFVDKFGGKIGIGGSGMIGVMVGKQKSGKSFVSNCIAASALDKGRNKLNFSLDVKDRGILYFDTEQSPMYFDLNQKFIQYYGNHKKNDDKIYQSFLFRDFGVQDRIRGIEEVLKRFPNPALIIIDGAVDLVRDYNSLEETNEIIQKLMTWSKQHNALLITVLHLNKGDGKLRGHIGTELQNKCDFSIEVIKQKEDDGESFKVNHRDHRGKAFKSFRFERDENNFPVVEGIKCDDSVGLFSDFILEVAESHQELISNIFFKS